MAHDSIVIFGKHAVEEALQHASHAIDELFVAESMDDPALRKLIEHSKIHVSDIKKGVPLVPRDAVHQGVIASISASALTQSYKDFIAKIEPTPDSLLIVLDELQDPHNVGSIIRSAAAFGAAGVLIPSNNQAPLTGTVIKVSAGMTFRVPLVAIGNVNQTIRDLKEKGFWIYGLAGEAATPIMQEKFDAPSVLVVGNEGDGIRVKTLEHCDIPLAIPMNPQCESLNAAVSTAVALYAWSLKHPRAL